MQNSKMSHATLIIGEPGTGKSTSLRNLNPEETFIINVIGKSLPFKGSSKKYSVELKNYFQSDNADKIVSWIQAVSDRLPHIKNLIIDDFQYLMANECMERAFEKGYDKFIQIAVNAFKVLNILHYGIRSDLLPFILSHSDVDKNGLIKCKTIGKMLDSTISVDGKFSMVFHSEIVNGEYKFLTQREGNKMARSPMGMFENMRVDNDLNEIRKIIHNYYSYEQ